MLNKEMKKNDEERDRSRGLMSDVAVLGAYQSLLLSDHRVVRYCLYCSQLGCSTAPKESSIK